MQSVALSAEPRSAKRRAAVKKLRETGKIPAVIYGKVADPQALTIDRKAFNDMLGHHASEHILVDLNVEGDDRPKRLAMLQEIQHHPLNRNVLHADFHEISDSDAVTVSIPVESTGEPVGVKLGGGLLEHILYHVKVRGLVKDIPEIIVVDVSEMNADETLHIGELVAPANCEILGNKSNPVFTCSGKRGTQEDETPGQGDAAAPAEEKKEEEKK
ncbi:MAG: 50S ribosomal protein L25 [Limisphaerales bacterium]